jgi:hypothetical protein
MLPNCIQSQSNQRKLYYRRIMKYNAIQYTQHVIVLKYVPHINSMHSNRVKKHFLSYIVYTTEVRGNKIHQDFISPSKRY